MPLDYISIMTNTVFTAVIGVLVTQGLFFAIARIFKYDFIFPIETGRKMLDLSEDFYSNMYAGIRGLMIHIGFGIFIMAFYSLVFIHVLGLLFDLGPYTFETPQGTAIFENVFWVGLMGLVMYISWVIKDNKYDKFSFFLFLYVMTLVIIMGIIFGLYLFKQPGIVTI